MQTAATVPPSIWSSPTAAPAGVMMTAVDNAAMTASMAKRNRRSRDFIDAIICLLDSFFLVTLTNRHSECGRILRLKWKKPYDFTAIV